MNHRDSPLYWSFPAGTWFQTHVRISVYFPFLVLLIAYQLENLRLGLVFSGILFLVVLAHEFGHVVTARFTGGSGNEILIWPLGGLAFVQPAGSFRSQLLTPAAGPLVNLVLCLVTLPAVLALDDPLAALKPLVFPSGELSHPPLTDLLADLQILVFFASWLLLLVNLIPVFPLDGGRILQAVLMTRWAGETVTVIYIRIGFVIGFVMMFAGLFMESHWLVFFGAVVLILNIQESQQMRAADAYDESFMGYDFSQGYTSLEQSGNPARKRRQGLLQRWREKRRDEKLQRMQERAAEVDRELDAILEKVHTNGLDSLTDSERRLLRRASDRFREQEEEH